MKILITGGKGQLGQAFSSIKNNYNHEVICASKEDFDILHPRISRFRIKDFDLVVNAAGYANVEKAQIEKEKCRQLNEIGALKVAQVCKEEKVKLIHISSDFVFTNDNRFKPHPEEYTTRGHFDLYLYSIYGYRKWRGECIVKVLDPSHIILRTSWLYSEFGKNFVKSIIKAGKENKEIKVVMDQIGSPTYAVDLAEFILENADKMQDKHGYYHYAGDAYGGVSKDQFAESILWKAGIGLEDCQVKGIISASGDYKSLVKRPEYSVLSTEKTRSHFGIKIPRWQESLKRCIERLKAIGD